VVMRELALKSDTISAFDPDSMYTRKVDVLRMLASQQFRTIADKSHIVDQLR
jgi:hypothetical protein